MRLVSPSRTVRGIGPYLTVVAASRRWRVAMIGVAAAGIFVCSGQWLIRASLGAWPSHDAVAYWLAARHLLEGEPVYEAVPYLAFLYAPPWAVLSVPLALLSPHGAAALVLCAEILALRYIAGSWVRVGLVAWIPFTSLELVTGNINLLIAAAIYASATSARGSGAATVLFAFAKLSPGVMLLLAPRVELRNALIAALVLLGLTLPWAHLWTEWVVMLGPAQAIQATNEAVPLLPRLILAVPLVIMRQPWSVALAAALLAPGFRLHSVVLLYPGVRLLLEEFGRGRWPTSVSATRQPVPSQPLADHRADQGLS